MYLCTYAHLDTTSRHQEAYAYFLSAEELLCERLDTIHPRINCIRNNLEKVKAARVSFPYLMTSMRINVCVCIICT